MPINNYGSNLRVETVVGNGEVVDNDEWVAERAYREHQTPANEPWAQGYMPPSELEEKIAALYDEFAPVEADPEIINANRKDLKTRNLDK
jgi:hypothetical protein